MNIYENENVIYEANRYKVKVQRSILSILLGGAEYVVHIYRNMPNTTPQWDRIMTITFFGDYDEQVLFDLVVRKIGELLGMITDASISH